MYKYPQNMAEPCLISIIKLQCFFSKYETLFIEHHDFDCRDETKMSRSILPQCFQACICWICNINYISVYISRISHLSFASMYKYPLLEITIHAPQILMVINLSCAPNVWRLGNGWWCHNIHSQSKMSMEHASCSDAIISWRPPTKHSKLIL